MNFNDISQQWNTANSFERRVIIHDRLNPRSTGIPDYEGDPGAVLNLIDHVLGYHPLRLDVTMTGVSHGEILYRANAERFPNGPKYTCLDTNFGRAICAVFLMAAGYILHDPHEGISIHVGDFTIRQRMTDWQAFVTEAPGIWEAGKTPEEALKALVITTQ